MYGKPDTTGKGVVLAVELSRPKSRGTIRLKSANPFEYPSIDPQYLAEKQDVDVLIDGKLCNEFEHFLVLTPRTGYRMTRSSSVR